VTIPNKLATKTKAPVEPIPLIGTGQIMPAGREGILNFRFWESCYT